MNTRVLSVDEGCLAVVHESRPEAHGAMLWSLPALSVDDAVLFEIPARGDAILETVVVKHASPDEVPDTVIWVPLETLKAEWAAGRALGPEVSLAIHWAASRLPASRAWEVAPGIRVLPVRTATLPPATHTNAFLLGTTELLLVEPGTANEDELAYVRAEVEDACARGGRLVGIFATHHHADHVAGARAWADEFGTPLIGHRETATRCPGLEFDHFLSEGDRITLGEMAFDVWHTPGHAAGHLCLMETRCHLMLAGDMVAGVGTILIEPGDGEMNVYLEQLDRLAESGVGALVPAHGGLVVDGAAAFRRTAQHRRMREAKVVSALGPAAREEDELLAEVYADAPRHLWPLARLSLRAHLLGLLAERRAVQHEDGWALPS